MVKKSISPEEVVNFLNDLLKDDRIAITTLFSLRTSCNEKMAKHPSVQVMGSGPKDELRYFVGLIGIINGMFGTDKHRWGCIAMDIEETEDGIRLKGFKLLKERMK